MIKISTQTSHSNHSTRKTTLLRSISTLTAPILCAFLIGCSSPPSPPQKKSSTIVALVNSHPITTTDLWPHLAEIAGQQILNELILTHLLNTAATNNNWTITDTNIQNELHALITTLNQSTPQSNQSAPRLIQTIRQQRGLGPTRFNALLRRNAILRKLIASDPTIASQIQTQTQSHIQSALTKLDTPPTPEQSQKIRHRAKLVAEQLAMETYAQNLIDQNNVLIMDRALKWSGD